MSALSNRATYINRMVTFYENISVEDEEEDEIKDEEIKQLKFVTSQQANKFRSSPTPDSRRAPSTSTSPPSKTQGRNNMSKKKKDREKQRENVHTSLYNNHNQIIFAIV
jgi:hypothetical protein